jgi:hypothetical protein
MSWGDDLLMALRTRLVTVSGLPAARRWANTTGTPDPTQPFVEDGFTTLDSQYRECGPDAWRRTDATYRVSIRVPLGTDAHAAMALAGAIETAFASTPMTVGTYPLEILSTRAGPSLSEAQWLHVPVSLSVTFDHP